MNDPAPTRSSIFDNPWFWVHLFSIAGLIGMLMIGNKADRMQAHRDANFAKRQHSLELQAGYEEAKDPEVQTAREERFVDFTPFYWLFGLIALISWVMLWRKRLSRRKESISNFPESQ